MKRMFSIPGRMTLALAGLLLTMMVLLSACGGGRVAPTGSEILFSPSEFTLTDGGGTASQTESVRFLVSVLDAEGHALNDVDVTFSMLGVPWGVADPRITVNGNDLTNPVTLTTDSSGSIELWVAFVSGGGLEYKFNILATSGNVSETLSFEVKAN